MLKDGRTASFVIHTNWYTSRRELYLKVADQEFNLTNPSQQFQRTDVRLRQLPVSMDADATPEPWSFEFLKYQDATGGALHCLIGFDNGELWECSVVESSPGRYALKVERKFLAHSNAITSISVSPDRAMLATSSLDGTIRIWRLLPPPHPGGLGLPDRRHANRPHGRTRPAARRRHPAIRPIHVFRTHQAHPHGSISPSTNWSMFSCSRCRKNVAGWLSSSTKVRTLRALRRLCGASSCSRLRIWRNPC